MREILSESTIRSRFNILAEIGHEWLPRNCFDVDSDLA